MSLEQAPLIDIPAEILTQILQWLLPWPFPSVVLLKEWSQVEFTPHIWLDTFKTIRNVLQVNHAFKLLMRKVALEFFIKTVNYSTRHNLQIILGFAFLDRALLGCLPTNATNFSFEEILNIYQNAYTLGKNLQFRLTKMSYIMHQFPKQFHDVPVLAQSASSKEHSSFIGDSYFIYNYHFSKENLDQFLNKTLAALEEYSFSSDLNEKFPKTIEDIYEQLTTTSDLIALSFVGKSITENIIKDIRIAFSIKFENENLSVNMQLIELKDNHQEILLSGLELLYYSSYIKLMAAECFLTALPKSIAVVSLLENISLYENDKKYDIFSDVSKLPVSKYAPNHFFYFSWVERWTTFVLSSSADKINFWQNKLIQALKNLPKQKITSFIHKIDDMFLRSFSDSLRKEFYNTTLWRFVRMHSFLIWEDFLSKNVLIKDAQFPLYAEALYSLPKDKLRAVIGQHDFLIRYSPVFQYMSIHLPYQFNVLIHRILKVLLILEHKNTNLIKVLTLISDTENKKLVYHDDFLLTFLLWFNNKALINDVYHGVLRIVEVEQAKRINFNNISWPLSNKGTIYLNQKFFKEKIYAQRITLLYMLSQGDIFFQNKAETMMLCLKKNENIFKRFFLRENLNTCFDTTVNDFILKEKDPSLYSVSPTDLNEYFYFLVNVDDKESSKRKLCHENEERPGPISDDKKAVGESTKSDNEEENLDNQIFEPPLQKKRRLEGSFSGVTQQGRENTVMPMEIDNNSSPIFPLRLAATSSNFNNGIALFRANSITSSSAPSSTEDSANTSRPSSPGGQ